MLLLYLSLELLINFIIQSFVVHYYAKHVSLYDYADIFLLFNFISTGVPASDDDMKPDFKEIGGCNGVHQK